MDLSKTENNIIFGYCKRNIIHEFRTLFSTLNIAFNSLNSILPVLIDSYERARDLKLVQEQYSDEYLKLLSNSVVNSLIEIRSSDSSLNNLLLLINSFKFGSGTKSTLSVRKLLERAMNDFEKTSNYRFLSNDDFEIDYYQNDMEACLPIFFEELLECQKEQKTNSLLIQIDRDNKLLILILSKSKSNSYVFASMNRFIEGKYDEKYGLGLYLLKLLLVAQSGAINYLEDDVNIRFVISF